MGCTLRAQRRRDRLNTVHPDHTYEPVLYYKYIEGLSCSCTAYGGLLRKKATPSRTMAA